MEKKVLLKVSNAVHISKDNQELKCLLCRIEVILPSEKGVDTMPIIEEWKDFKQKALNFEKEITKNDIQKTENGIKINGFSIPWNMQYFITQLEELGYFND